jgi:AcrR family transcriptional regulator
MSMHAGTNEPMPLRRRELAEWRRERILDAALQVFGAKGFDAATTRDLAAGAGVTSGLIYHYFANKEALLVAVIRERGFTGELIQLLTEATDRPASVVLPEVVTGFSRIMSERAALIGLFVSGIANPMIKAGLDEMLEETQRLLGDYLSTRVDAGELRPHDSRTLVAVLFNTCAVGILLDRRVDPVEVADIALHGVTTRSRKVPSRRIGS